jgi:PAS domain S-box-containing protein
MVLFGLLGTVLSVLADRLRRAREQAERRSEELARQREWLRVTLASIGDGVIATDAQGRVSFMNSVAQALTGWKEGEALRRPLGEVCRIHDAGTREPVDCLVQQVSRQGTGVTPSGPNLLLGRGGTATPVARSASPIRSGSGEVLGVVLTLRDFSEQARLEAELREHAEELAGADRRKDEFLAMLGHELRNPLAPLKNAAYLLRLPKRTEEQTRWAGEVIERQVGQMSRLVDDLLDVSRITRGKVTLRKEVVELAAAIERAVEISRPLIEARRHELVESLPPGPVWLEADPVRLAQVIANLLNNAAKYTPDRGRITLSASQEGAEVVLRVRDNGVGIAPEVLPHVFELFTQDRRTLDRSQGGLGIGLTLVKGLVEMHGGSVQAFSEGPGRGCEFVVRLPAKASLGPDKGEEGHPTASAPSAGCRVLVVDDNVDATESLALLLRMSGHEVHTALDGPAALQVAEAFRPEAVLLDIVLPGMDGYEVARRLRHMAGLENAFLVAVTGYGQEEDRRRAEEAGFDAHLVKPADPVDLKELLARSERSTRG